MSSSRLTCIVAAAFTALLAACANAPAANKRQAALAAKECGLPEWEWTRGFGTFDGEPDYPGEPALSFHFSAQDNNLLQVSARVEATEKCLAKSLSRQGVGANIIGSVETVFQAPDNATNAQTH